MTASDANRSISKSVDRYRFLFENSTEPILIIEGGRFVDCNQAAIDMLGFADKESLLGLTPGQISPEYQPDGQLSSDKSAATLALLNECPYQCFEWTHTRANGELFPVEVSLTAISTATGTTLHTTWRDITQRKRLEEELRHSQKLDVIGKLAGGIAHDFGNQLMPILLYAEMLAEALEDQPDLRSMVTEVQRAAECSSKLVDKLLALSRKESIQQVVVDINEATVNMLDVLRNFIGANIAIRLDDAGQPLWVRTAPGDVEQIVLNLASNARDAMPNGGNIDLTLSVVQEPTAEFARLELSDNGVGMDEETRSQLFEPFFTTKQPGSGNGLGMSTVHRLVTEAGGRINAQSSLADGTSIELFLPIADDEEITHAMAESDEPDTGAARRVDESTKETEAIR